MKTFTIITGAGDSPSRETQVDLRGFGLSLLGLAKRGELEAWAHFAEGRLTVVLHGRKGLIHQLVAAYFRSHQENRGSLHLIIRDDVELPIDLVPSVRPKPGALLREKLTRRFLSSLPEGAFVVSKPPSVWPRKYAGTRLC